MIPVVDPLAGIASAASTPWWWAKAMPPLWQYFLLTRKQADESIAAPKGHGPPGHAAFPLKTSSFQGRRKGP